MCVICYFLINALFEDNKNLFGYNYVVKKLVKWGNGIYNVKLNENQEISYFCFFSILIAQYFIFRSYI